VRVSLRGCLAALPGQADLDLVFDFAQPTRLMMTARMITTAAMAPGRVAVPDGSGWLVNALMNAWIAAGDWPIAEITSPA
jgi:hypothetical protein